MVCGGLALALAACRSKPQPLPAEKVLVEWRGSNGQLLLQLGHSGDNFGDERLGWYAGPEHGGTLQRLPGQAGSASVDNAHLTVRRAHNGDLALTSNAQLRLAVDRRGDVLRVGNGEGFPVARVRTEGAVARMHGPGGELQASATHEGGRIVVVDRENKPLGFFTGALVPEQALLVFLPGLSQVEQALLLVTPVPAVKAVKP